MKARTAGFTTLELMIVLAVTGIVITMTFPRMQNAFVKTSLRGAKQRTTSYIVMARAAAIQSGQQVSVVRVGDTLKVTMDSGGTRINLGPRYNMRSEYGVVMTPTKDSIAFDQRGLALGLASIEKYRFTRSGKTDSVCINRRGKVAAGCTP